MIQLNRGSLIVVLILSSACTTTHAPDPGESVAANCHSAIQNPPSNKRQNDVYFGPENMHFRAWNLLDSPSEFNGLALKVSEYEPKHIIRKEGDDACSATIRNTYVDTILVTKLGDWQQQHGNGLIFGPLPTQKSLTFGELRSLKANLSLNIQRSTIPSQEDVHQHFFNTNADSHATNEAFEEGTATIGITIFGEMQDDMSQYSAHYLFDLSYDQWVPVPNLLALPMIGFTFHLENSDKTRPATLDEVSNTIIKGVRLVAESTHGQVLRHVHPEFYAERKNTMPKELFKELAVKIHRLELIRR